jgi:hypothetical protein
MTLFDCRCVERGPLRRLVLAAGLACALPAWPGAARADAALHTPAEAQFGYERIDLPGDERLGLVGASYLLEPLPGLHVGPALYGAGSGRRGGLFVVGAEAAWRVRLAGPLQLQAGLYAGGGGGGAAPVGGGLMLRPHADLLWDFGSFRAGLSASQVRFPNGQIDSKQLGLVLAFDTGFDHFVPPAFPGDEPARRYGVGFDRFNVVGGMYRPSSGSTGVSGTPLHSRIGYAGARAERIGANGLTAGIEAAGAASGGAAGYAEVLGTVGFERPFADDRFTLGARAALGLAGGGDIATGGGLLTKAALYGSLRLAPNASLGLELGRARAPQGHFEAGFVALNWRWELDHPQRDVPATQLAQQEFIMGIESYRHAARRAGPDRNVQNVTLKLNRFLDESWYLSGQAHSAYQGDAGGFSVGLVGLGYRTRSNGSWQFGAELLGGAAGGGGVASSGGAIVQPMLYASYAFTPSFALQLGAGRVKSLHGSLNSPVFDLTLGYAFGVASRR